MLDIGDPAFKLFGKTIPLLSSDEVSGDSANAALSSDQMKVDQDPERHAAEGLEEQKSSDESVLQEDPPLTSATEKEPNLDSQTASGKGTSEDQNSANSVDENSAAESQQDHEKAQGEGSKNSPDKTLKKPDKILPCPRCKSMDTKFCYYNNYNVNQPRHFCKSCQRYWTAGGTMRNVPVGAGRRKNKSLSSKYCHISISEALQAARIDLPNGLHHPHKQGEAGLKMNGTVLNFGTDSPLCESMASMMNLAEKKVLNGTRNGVLRENVDDRSSGSSTVTTSSSMVESGLKVAAANSIHQMPQNIHGFTGQQVPCFPGFQLAYGWNPAVPLPPPPPGFFPSATTYPPMPFYPAPYWNGAAMPWSIPWVSPASPTLGKHSRDGDTLQPSSEAGESKSSSQVLVPKTLRIDDPEEAAKSSIWTTLGLKKIEPASNGGFFKGLQSKSADKKHKMESFPALNANPAALARSVSFQETV